MLRLLSTTPRKEGNAILAKEIGYTLLGRCTEQGTQALAFHIKTPLPQYETTKN